LKSAVIIFLAVAAYGVIHSLLASLPAKAQARRLFGPAADRLSMNDHGNEIVGGLSELYFALKHTPRRALPRLLWRLYRGHVMNRPYARQGAGFLLARHRAWAAGLAAGWRTYRGARRGGPG